MHASLHQMAGCGRARLLFNNHYLRARRYIRRYRAQIRSNLFAGGAIRPALYSRTTAARFREIDSHKPPLALAVGYHCRCLRIFLSPHDPRVVLVLAILMVNNMYFVRARFSPSRKIVVQIAPIEGRAKERERGGECKGGNYLNFTLSVDLERSRQSCE